MTTVRWFLLGAVTILMGLISIFLAPFPPRGWGINRMGRPWSRMVLAIWGVKLEGERASGRGPRIVMANHTSLLDIPVLFAVLPDRLAFMAKKSLFDLPVLGWAMRAAGFIPVDREDRSGAAATVRQAPSTATLSPRAMFSMIFSATMTPAGASGAASVSPPSWRVSSDSSPAGLSGGVSISKSMGGLSS